MDKRKIFIVATLLILTILVIILSLAKNHFTGILKKEQPQLSIQPNPYADHPMLFFANLEFNPKTHFVIQHKVGTVNGDLPFFAATQPSPNPKSFQYKVEVTTEKGVIVSTGWTESSIELVKTAKGNYTFTIYTENKPNAYVRIYLPDKTLVWTGKIP